MWVFTAVCTRCVGIGSGWTVCVGVHSCLYKVRGYRERVDGLCGCSQPFVQGAWV